METQIQSLHFTAKQELQNYIYDKMEGLNKLFDRLEAAKVTLKVDNDRQRDNKMAEVSVRMPGMQMFAKDHAGSFELAVTQAINEIKRQLQKHKAKLQNKTPNGNELEETTVI